MRIAILDPAAGISGDMLLGAFVDAGLDAAWLEGVPGALGLEDVACRIEKVERAALTATKVTWVIRGEVETPGNPHGNPGPDHGHGRHVADLINMVERTTFPGTVKARATEAFRLIGEAEGRVHGVAPERVHLHEVGALDAVLDIVGAMGAVEQLGFDAVYHLPVAVGSGWIEAAHGHLPVPAPATALLLEGLEVVHGGPVTGEATTPTGAAILRVVSAGAPPSRWRLRRVGWGAGTRNPAAWPNALRLMVAETADEAGQVVVLAADVDDMSPEYLEPVRQALLAAGALECFTWPMQGKKGRLSFRLEALASPDSAAAVINALLAHSSSAGVRQITTSRVTLTRRQEIVELAGGDRVRIKVWDVPGGPRVKAEYDDVIAAATRQGRPALAVAREAETKVLTRMLGGGV